MSIIAASRLRASPVNTSSFIIEVDTTKAGTPSDQFQFTGALGDYDVVAKQNDIVVATFNDLSGAETITLPSSGVYNLEVKSKNLNGFNKIRFNNGGDKLKITDIKQWGEVAWSSFNSAFFGCSNMLTTVTDVPNLSSVTNMVNMFANATLANPDVSNWDVSSVTKMDSVFQGTDSFDQPLNNWDVSNVTSMNRMFFGARLFNQPLNSWDTSNVIDMTFMFIVAKAFNQPLNNWDVSQVTNMKGMFQLTDNFNQDLSDWCVSQFSEQPVRFDRDADGWVLPNSRPIWGTCP
jgi:surface protein